MNKITKHCNAPRNDFGTSLDLVAFHSLHEQLGVGIQTHFTSTM